MTPLVTIGITAFNAEDTIGRAIASALGQDWRPLDIVIVDDASTDESWAVISALMAAHQEVRAVRQTSNQGVGAARSQIVAEARGDFICFFDDDDESAPDRVRRQVERTLDYEAQFAGGSPVICHTARRQIMLDGGSRIERTMGERTGVVAPHGVAVARRILTGAPLDDGYGALATCSQMARTQTYRALGGFDAAFRRVEDTDFCVRAALGGSHFVGIGEPLVTQTLTRTSDKSLAGELTYKLMLIDKHRSVFDDARHYRYCRDWTMTKHHWLAGHRLRFAARMGLAALTHPRRTWQRLWLALPNLDGNRAFSRFHRNNERS
ncbi:glycosyltransferase [Devosia sp. XJ19-1]|uniref:Glycosyltransferase n=1 Tax=Devosia ureilytica TaxID=2952754 RepID=A0A9Q4AKW4_9HYPH|nr:glycosyltransferase family 2 protein [Devosia ureilytica]MCP8882615.1 glycosyltransferase [Devosia ureilytica]MCP8885498.1 glycosyltransferase [Devosia ureilytica]